MNSPLRPVISVRRLTCRFIGIFIIAGLAIVLATFHEDIGLSNAKVPTQKPAFILVDNACTLIRVKATDATDIMMAITRLVRDGAGGGLRPASAEIISERRHGFKKGLGTLAFIWREGRLAYLVEKPSGGYILAAPSYVPMGDVYLVFNGTPQ